MATSDSSSEAESRFANDPVARGFRDAPFSPARGGVSELYRKSRGGKKTTAKELSGPRNLSEELGLYHLMVHGDDPKRVRPARWIVLYRKHDLRFADTDAACLHGLWIHLSRALAINRSRVYERQFGREKSLGMASGLITQDGQVEISDQRLFDLFEREWPESAPDCIPAHVMEILVAGKTFRGTRI